MLDWNRVEELRSEVGEDAFVEVVELFLEEVSTAMAELDISADAATLEAQFHFLKGMALNLGFEGFATLCRTGEAAAAKGESCGFDIGEITGCYEHTRDEFMTRLSDAGYLAA